MAIGVARAWAFVANTYSRHGPCGPSFVAVGPARRRGPWGSDVQIAEADESPLGNGCHRDGASKFGHFDDVQGRVGEILGIDERQVICKGWGTSVVCHG